LTEIFFEGAIAHAKELDEYYRVNGKVKGPLHGLPVSVKVYIVSDMVREKVC
jgi:amidase